VENVENLREFVFFLHFRGYSVQHFNTANFKSQDSLAVVENTLGYLDGEAGGSIEAVPRGVGRGTCVRLEGDVGPQRG